MRKLRVAVVQFEHRNGNKEYNLERVRVLTDEAVKRGAELVVFPECCLSGYWFLRNLDREELSRLAEPVFDGPMSSAIRGIAKEHGIVLGAGLVEITREGKLHNTYIVSGPDGSMVKHRKLHTFISRHMESGSEYTVFDSPFECRIGVLTCYDNNINENVRITALKGADILLAPHQTGGCTSTNPHTMGRVERDIWDNREKDPESITAELCGPKGREWLMRWLPARAHDNGLFILFSNGIGVDDDEVRTGNSMILDPYGRILGETCKAGDDIVIADLDPTLLDEATGRRWIRTRRPDLYGDLVKPTGMEEDVRSVRFDQKGV
jgi:predicted amidohydrolase